MLLGRGRWLLVTFVGVCALGTIVLVTVGWVMAPPSPAPAQTPTSGPKVPGPASPPEGLGGPSRVTATWTAPVDHGAGPITQYRVLAFAVNGFAAGYCQVPAPTTTCSIDGLTTGAEYRLKVRAWNEAGYGPLSAPSAPVRAG